MPVQQRGYSWTEGEIRRDSDDTIIGKLYEFDDEPVNVAYDVSHERPRYLEVTFLEDIVRIDEEFDIAKVVAEDDHLFIPRAAVFNVQATDADVAHWWEKFHPE